MQSTLKQNTMESILKLSNGREVAFTRINNDVNGNPRYVCHFTSIPSIISEFGILNIEIAYKKSLEKAKKFGGKRYHAKSYGGGIVFQSYNLNELKPLFE